MPAICKHTAELTRYVSAHDRLQLCILHAVVNNVLNLVNMLVAASEYLCSDTDKQTCH